MEWIAFGDLAEGALLLIDSEPIIYVEEDHPKLASRFRPLFRGACGRPVALRHCNNHDRRGSDGPHEDWRRSACQTLSRCSRIVATDRPQWGHRRKRGAIARGAPAGPSRRCPGRERAGYQRRGARHSRPRFFARAIAPRSVLSPLRASGESIWPGPERRPRGGPPILHSCGGKAQASTFARRGRKEANPASFRNTAARSLLWSRIEASGRQEPLTPAVVNLQSDHPRLEFS